MIHKLKKLFKFLISDYRHIIYITVIVALLVLTFIFFRDSFKYLYYSIICFFKDLIYYFCELFNIDYYIDMHPLDYMLESSDGNYFSLIPINWDVFVARFKAFFGVFINIEYVEYYWHRFLFKLGIVTRWLLLIVMLIVFIIMIFSSFFESCESGIRTKKSINLKRFEKFRNKYIDSVRQFVFKFYLFSKKHSYYVLIVILILMFDFKIFSILIDFVGFIFYFFSSYDFKFIFYFLATVLVYLSPLILNIPLLVYVIIGYYLFDRWRLKTGYNRLYHYENKNKGFINSLGVLCMVVGPPGSGKTTLITDMTISSEEMFRTKALNIIMDIRSRFWNFPFSAFEMNLKKHILSGKIKNRFQMKKYINSLKDTFVIDPSNKNIFGYDYLRHDLYFYDGNVNEYIWDALRDYAEAYMMYIRSSPLSVSNYAIRHNGVKIDNGAFPIWNYDYFREDGRLMNYFSRYSKVIDFDMLRLGKKFIKDSENAFVFDGGQISTMEWGKERGNQYDLIELKESDNGVNQKNDCTNHNLKVIRHYCTIRNTTFVRFFDDDQRAQSLNADNRELHEHIITIIDNETDFVTCLPHYVLLPALLKSIYDYLVYLDKKFSNVRKDRILLMYLINYFKHIIYKFLEKRKRIFDVKVLSLNLSSGNMEDSKGTKDYYLCKKKIFSKRFNTAAYGSFFEPQFNKQSKGFEDLKEYDDYITSVEELNMQNSYFVKKIKGLNELDDL